MRPMLATALVFLSINVFGQANPAVNSLTIRPDRLLEGPAMRDRLIVRWKSDGAATDGRLTVTAAFAGAAGPYVTTYSAEKTSVTRRDPANELSDVVATQFTTAIPLQAPLDLSALASLAVEASFVPKPNDAAVLGERVARAIDVDLDAAREYFQQRSQMAQVTAERDHAMKQTRQTKKALNPAPAQPTADPPAITVDRPVVWTNGILLGVESTQPVALHAELYRLVNGKRTSLVADDQVATVLLPNQQEHLRFKKVAPGTTYEVALVARDARTREELLARVVRLPSGEPIATLPDTTHEPQAKFVDKGKKLKVRVDNSVSLPLRLTNTRRVVATIETRNAAQNWVAHEPIIREVSGAEGNAETDLDVMIPAALPIGENYRVKVRALSPVDEAAVTTYQDVHDLVVPEPIATTVEVEFSKDAVTFRAPTKEPATIGVTIGKAKGGEDQSKSGASVTPEVALPLSSVQPGTPFEFTVTVRADDDSGRVHQQNLAFKIKPEELKAKSPQDKQALVNFTRNLATGEKANLSTRNVLQTGLAAFLQVLLRSALFAVGG